MFKTKIFSKKIITLVCSASLFVSSIGLQNKKISATNDRHSLYSHDLEKEEGITEASLQKLESHTDNKVEEVVEKHNLINQFLSETKGLFPKDKDQEIKLMLNDLSSDQLKKVRNLKFKTPWKEVLKELAIIPNGLNDFLRGRWVTGCITLLVIGPLLTTFSKDLLQIGYKVLQGEFKDVTEIDNLPNTSLLLPAMMVAKFIACTASAPSLTRRENYRVLKDAVCCE